MIRPELYLHIGRPKTGTTSIQKFLSYNRKSLASHRILYPSTGLQDDAHHLLAVSLLGNIPRHIQHLSTPNHKTIFGNLLREITKARACKVIISSELFTLLTGKHENYNRARLAYYLSEFRTKIVIYFRYQPDLLQSSYVQEVKNNRLLQREELSEFKTRFLKRKANNYRFSVSQWADCFGLKNILIRPFDKPQLQHGDVVSDFLYVSGCGDIPLRVDGDHSTGTRNVSPSAYRIDLLNEMSGFGLSKKKRSRLFHSVMDMPLLDFESSRLCFLSPTEYSEIARNYESSNNQLAKLTGQPGFFPSPVAYEEQYIPYPGMKADFLEKFERYFAQTDPSLYRELMSKGSPLSGHLENVYRHRFGGIRVPGPMSMASTRSMFRRMLPERIRYRH